MKQLKIYFEEIWKGFEAPEKPSHLDPNHYTSVSEYQKAYAAARAAALPIVNPSLITLCLTNDNKWWLPNPEVNTDYDWPGTWEVKTEYYCTEPGCSISSRCLQQGNIKKTFNNRPITSTDSGHQFSEGGEDKNWLYEQKHW